MMNNFYISRAVNNHFIYIEKIVNCRKNKEGYIIYYTLFTSFEDLITDINDKFIQDTLNINQIIKVIKIKKLCYHDE